MNQLCGPASLNNTILKNHPFELTRPYPPTSSQQASEKSG